MFPGRGAPFEQGAGLRTKTLNRALKVDLRLARTRRALAKVHAMKGEFGKAEEYLRRNLADQPGSLQAMADLGDLFLVGEGLEARGRAYDDIRKKAPRTRSYMRMGEYHKSRNEWDAAKRST
jgi:tetratricopeptide (TPR) repeat protein